jgi:hypothetical protein
MDHFFRPRKKGAGFVGVIADGNDGIEDDIPEAIDMFGDVPRDIYSGLGHNLDRRLIEAMGLDTCGICFDRIAFERSCPSFRHLAATGIAGTQKKYLEFF